MQQVRIKMQYRARYKRLSTMFYPSALTRVCADGDEPAVTAVLLTELKYKYLHAMDLMSVRMFELELWRDDKLQSSQRGYLVKLDHTEITHMRIVWEKQQ